MTVADHALPVVNQTSSRRDALCGGVLLAALGGLSLRRGVAAQATPGALEAASDVLLVQSFSQGNLFPTQGDVGVLPYTAILWDAADRGFLFFNPASGAAGVVSTETVLTAINPDRPGPYAVLLALPGENSDGTGPSSFTWALRIGLGELGSDPGSMTYQGAPLPEEDATAWLGTAPQGLPEGPQQIGAGYLILSSLFGFDATGQIHLDVATVTR